MRKLVFILILIATFIIGNIVAIVAPFIFTVLIPTTFKTSQVKISVTWQNGTALTSINWGTLDNNTKYSLSPLINITNTGDKDAVLTLSAVDQVNITALTLAWNATSPLSVGSYTIVQINQTATTSGASSSYTTKIDATG